jgi:hypothetical protein
MFIVHAYQTSQYVVPRGGIFLGKWRSSSSGISDGKMNVQSACALNTPYIYVYVYVSVCASIAIRLSVLIMVLYSDGTRD